MKIFPVDKIRELDDYTITHEPIASIDLMERAATQCANWLLAKLPARVPFLIVCGSGNNGGDGLVVARLLAQKKRQVQVYAVRGSRCSEDFSINYDRLQKNPKIRIFLPIW